MSDPRGPYDRPGEPLGTPPDPVYGQRRSNAGWAIGAVIIIVLIVIGFAFYGNQTNTVGNAPTTTTAQRSTPPTTTPPPATTPPSTTTPAPGAAPSGAATPNR
jgi:hypothetical protein